MIINADDDDPHKAKDPPVDFPTVRYPDRAASHRSLPDYETSQALAFTGFNDSQSTLHKPPPPRRFLDSRVWRAAIISLVVYIILTLVIGVPIIVHKLEDEQKYPYTPLSYMNWDDKKSSPPYASAGINNISEPVQPGIYPVCDNYTSVEYLDTTGPPIVLASATYRVSPNGQFSITSNASCSNDINIVQGAFYTGINPDQSVQDAVISVTMQSSSPSVFSQTFTCTALATNFTELSLLVPDSLAPTDSLMYNVSLLFPQTTTTPSHVNIFATFLPLFDQRFDSFDNEVTLDEVVIGGVVSRVTADSLQAKRIIVDTSLEPVTGTFHANASLHISTVMAPIYANISLYNDPNAHFPTSLDVHTGNSNLTVNINLLAPNPGPPPRPNFITNLRTFSGTLAANVLHDPTSPPTVIQLNALNDLGPTNVTLDSLFQGVFQVSTIQATAYISQDNSSMPDPWSPGQGRNIQMDYNFTSRLSGWIGWGNEGPPWNGYQEGQAVLETSLADATLIFLG